MKYTKQFKDEDEQIEISRFVALNTIERDYKNADDILKEIEARGEGEVGCEFSIIRISK